MATLIAQLFRPRLVLAAATVGVMTINALIPLGPSADGGSWANITITVRLVCGLGFTTLAAYSLGSLLPRFPAGGVLAHLLVNTVAGLSLFSLAVLLAGAGGVLHMELVWAGQFILVLYLVSRHVWSPLESPTSFFGGTGARQRQWDLTWTELWSELRKRTKPRDRGLWLFYSVATLILVLKFSKTWVANWDLDSLWYHLPSTWNLIQTGSFVHNFDYPTQSFTTAGDALTVLPAAWFSLGGAENGIDKTGLHLVGQMVHFVYGLTFSLGAGLLFCRRLGIAFILAIVGLAWFVYADEPANWAVRAKIDFIFCTWLLTGLYTLLVASALRPSVRHGLHFGRAFLVAFFIIGTLFSIRYFAVLFALPAILYGLVLLVTTTTVPRHRIFWVAGLIGLGAALPLYIKQWATTGNPVYPFLIDIFTPTSIESGYHYFEAYSSRAGGAVDGLSMGQLIINTIFTGVGNYLYPIGLLSLIITTKGLGKAQRNHRRLLIIAAYPWAVFAILIAAGISTFPVRYSFSLCLLILPIALLPIQTLYRYARHQKAYASILLTIVLLAGSRMEVDLARLGSARLMGPESKVAPVRRVKNWSYPNAALFWAANNLPPHATILFWKSRQVFYAEQPVLTATRGAEMRRIWQSPQATQVVDYLRQRGITHVVDHPQERRLWFAEAREFPTARLLYRRLTQAGTVVFKKKQLRLIQLDWAKLQKLDNK